MGKRKSSPRLATTSVTECCHVTLWSFRTKAIHHDHHLIKLIAISLYAWQGKLGV